MSVLQRSRNTQLEREIGEVDLPELEEVEINVSPSLSYVIQRKSVRLRNFNRVRVFPQ